MNMVTIDWVIVLTFLAVLFVAGHATSSHARTVSGFLAANRCAGRYLVTVAYNMAQVGVITLVWYFQVGYDVGFTQMWWGYLEGPAMIFLAISGWVIYRFRQTRALTLAQFFEARYSKRFRIFSGMVAFGSGLLNYGIFPGVTARFFIAVCGFPEAVSVAGLSLPTFPLVMAILLMIALYLVFAGGQIAVMVTDFLQGVFCNGVFIFLCFWFMCTIPWPAMQGAMLSMPEGTSFVNPLGLSGEKNFDIFYWLISAFIILYSARAWQGDSGYNAAPLNAHEARMAQLLSGWRWRVLMLVTIIVPLAVRTFLTQPEFAPQAEAVHQAIAQTAGGNEALAAEMRTPLALAVMLPAGLLGLLVAAMLGAAVSTDETYLHSWGSIFVQDVILPLRGKPLPPRQHLLLLKISIFFVAVFAFCFSLWFELGEYIAMFGALTAGIFVGGAGAAIIGGLYWRRGSLQAAWATMAVGITISVWGITMMNLPNRVLDSMESGAFNFVREHCLWLRGNMTGMTISFVAMAASLVTYFLVSVLGPRTDFDLDKLLHRKAAARDTAEPEGRRSWLEHLGFDREFKGSDRIIAAVTVAWPLFWTIVLLAVTPYLWWRQSQNDPVSDLAWADYWQVWTWGILWVSVGVWVWWTIGGFRDLWRLFQRLRAYRDDATDDGSVTHEPKGSP
ncbi:MAG: sodium:solute symporter [Phycisphaerales bacterium]|nr:sodium:solute symporter [Phycisphaerales bacterium]